MPKPRLTPPLAPRRGRWQAHNDRRRERILEAAIEELESHPAGAEVSIQQIADRAGLAKSVVYRQFEGRDDLDRRTRSRIVADFAEPLESALNIWDGSLDDILTRSVTVVVDWFAAHPRLYEFLRHGPAVGDGNETDAVSSTKDMIAGKAQVLVSGLAGAIGIEDEAAFETMTFALVSMVEATVGRWARTTDPSLTKAELVAQLVGHVWSILDGAIRARGISVDFDEPLVQAINQLAAQMST